MHLRRGLIPYTVRSSSQGPHGGLEDVSLVLTHMHTYSVEEMRELLLEYGATDTRRLRQHFRICQAAIENDPIWLANFHHDPR